MMPLGHAFVVLMSRNLAGSALNTCAFLLGLTGIIVALCGNRLKSRAMQVLCGAFAGVLVWGGWVEFIFIQYGKSLHVPPFVENGIIITKPEYLMMPTSLPFAALAFIMYLFWAPTQWRLIIKLRDFLKIRNIENREDNLSIKSFIELNLLIWWAYLVLLICFDRTILGESHIVTLMVAGGCLLNFIILFYHSLKNKNWASALRQAIVNVCVLWTFVEVMIKLKLFKEIWIYPERYIIEMIVILLSFVTATCFIAFLGHRQSNKHE